MEEELPYASLWDGGDYELFIALRGLFAMNKFLDAADVSIPLAETRMSDIPVGEKKKLRELLQKLNDFRAKYHRKVPALKVLSAIAVCKDFKVSEENHLGPLTLFDWEGCDGAIGGMEGCNSLHCGFCRYILKMFVKLRMQLNMNVLFYHNFFRFAKWIHEQNLPEELKDYCKNVLDYLGAQNEDFTDRPNPHPKSSAQYDLEDIHSILDANCNSSQ